MSGLLLAIDTSTRMASAALARPEGLVAEYTWQSGMNQTRQLLPVIHALLGENGLTVEQLTAVAVASGPGSFNGLRVGMATAKGFAYSLSIPLLAATTLEVAAYPHAAAPWPVLAVQDAGRKEVAWAVFRDVPDSGWTRLVPEHITPPDALLKAVRGRTLVCGEPPEWLLPALRERKGVVLPPAAARVRRAAALAALAWRRLDAGEIEDLNSLEPLYLRRPPITQRRESATLRI